MGSGTYYTNKVEWIVFKPGTYTYKQLPELSLLQYPLDRVQRFKYLSHWVTDDLKINMDIDRERNMLARRFVRYTDTENYAVQSFLTVILHVQPVD